MQPLLILVSDKFLDAFFTFYDRLIGFGINLLIFQGSPEPFYKDIVNHPAFAVHANLNLFLLEDRDKFFACELRPLVGVEIFRFSSLQSLFQGLTAETRFQSVGDPPGDNITAVKIHDSYNIQESIIQTDIRVSSPGESHLQPLSEPDINLSAHPALIVPAGGRKPACQCGNNHRWSFVMRPIQWIARQR